MYPKSQKHWHLEGLRGLVRLQVVALHSIGSFVPGLFDGPGSEWQIAIRSSPLRALHDGIGGGGASSLSDLTRRGSGW